MNRRAYEVMSTPPVTVGVDASLVDAARAMYESNVGSVVVVDNNGGLAGIITRRDVIYLVATSEARRNPKVASVMSTSVITASPEEDLATILDRMRSAGVRHIVIVNGVKPVGVVSMWDIMNTVWQECFREGES